jgi:sugar lactone lactonase YvrE
VDGKRIVTWFVALAALAAPWVAQAQGTADPCDKNHYILRLKCGADDFPDIVTTGIATKTSIGAPLSIAVDAAGNVFFGNDQNVVYRVDPSGVLTLVAQPGGPPPPYDGWWINWNPNALAAVDGAGNVYFVDVVENRVQRIAIDGTIVTVAGHSGGRGDSGHYEDGEWVVSSQPANDAVVVGARAIDVFFVPTAVAIDDAGNLYVTSERADLYGLVKVAPDGVVASFMPFGCGDSAPGTVCQASGHFAVDEAGNAFVPDSGCRVHAFSASGGTDIGAGSGYYTGSPYGSPTCLYLGDGGPAKAAGIGPASAVALGPDGSLYIADPQFNCIHKVGADGIIRMLAGSCPGSWQFHGVLLAGPSGVAVDAAGTVYIADTGNERILKLTPDGVMTTIAGLLPAVPQP